MICTSCGTANPTGMHFCGMCGQPLMRAINNSERRRVTCVFIDMAGFSTLTHDLDPEDMRDLADEVLTVVANVIESYDGYVDALLGDGIIALFGAPHSHPDDPQRAVLAAAASLAAMEEVGRGRGLPLKGRAGVNTGLVIAGSVGSGRVRSYTVMGSAVNLAARLELAATPGEVWVGPETYVATRHRLLYANTGPLELRGFPDVKSAHRLVKVRRGQQPDPYGQVPFKGRAEELSRLRETYQDVKTRRRPRELWLVGEAGRGKTRLLQEFISSLDKSTTFWFQERPSEEFSWEPLGRQLFGLRVGEEQRSARHRVQRKLDELLPYEARWQRLVLSSLELAPQKTWTRLERRTIDRITIAWADLMAAFANNASGPEVVVVVVENEPRDPTLLEFLDLLTSAEAPILILRTTRHAPEPGCEVMELPPLSLENSLDLIEELTGPEVRVSAAALVEQVGGVPAYVLELGRALSITQEGSFPNSLAALLQARLDMLAVRPRRLLAYAALAGEVSWEGLLLELAGSGADTDLKVLVRENLLVARSGSAIADEVEFRFQSELLRNAVLRMIPYADRPLLHLRVGTWLEQHAPLAFSDLAAEHFEKGGSPEAAYANYLAAADVATTQGDWPAADRLYNRLLELQLPAATRAEGALAFGQAALSVGDKKKAEQALEQAELHIKSCRSVVRANLELVLEQLRLDLEGLPLRAMD